MPFARFNPCSPCCDGGGTDPVRDGPTIGGCVFPKILYATSYVGSPNNCSCVSGNTGLLNYIFTGSNHHWTGVLTLNGCSGNPTLNVDYWHDGSWNAGYKFWLIITGCGQGGSSVIVSDPCNVFPPTPAVAINPPNSCCGILPSDGFFVTVTI